jgi:hypothetical protein
MNRDPAWILSWSHFLRRTDSHFGGNAPGIRPLHDGESPRERATLTAAAVDAPWVSLRSTQPTSHYSARAPVIFPAWLACGAPRCAPGGQAHTSRVLQAHVAASSKVKRRDAAAVPLWKVIAGLPVN